MTSTEAMPETKRKKADTPPTPAESLLDRVIGTESELRMALDQARLTKRTDFLIVTQELMTSLTGSLKTKSLTYGSPAIRLYVDGTKEESDRIESMSAEKYYDFIGQKRRESPNGDE